MTRSWLATCWTYAPVTVAAAIVAAAAIAAQSQRASLRSKASTAASSPRGAAWITAADLAANMLPRSCLSAWCERRLHRFMLRHA